MLTRIVSDNLSIVDGYNEYDLTAQALSEVDDNEFSTHRTKFKNENMNTNSGNSADKDHDLFVVHKILSGEGDYEDKDSGDSNLSEQMSVRTTTAYIDTVDLPPVKDWQNRPIFVYDYCSKSSKSCPIGTPFDFESDFFIGQALIRIRDLPNSADQDFFNGRKRKSYVVIQGRFKHRLNYSDVVIGSEFAQPLRYAPPKSLNKVIRQVLQRMSPGVICELHGDNPIVLTSLCESCQTINVHDLNKSDKKIDENSTAEVLPDIASYEGILEYGMLPKIHKYSNSSKARKRYFANPLNRDSEYFDTESIYTFEFFDDLISYTDYRLHLMPLVSFDMVSVLDCQPFQFMVKAVQSDHSNKKTGYVWRFDVVHERFYENK